VTATVAPLVAGCGYEAAVTTRPGLNRVGDDLMLLRRMPLPETGAAAEILAEVSGLAQALSVLAARFKRRHREVRPE
jgi:hypothetical protein